MNKSRNKNKKGIEHQTNINDCNLASNKISQVNIMKYMNSFDEDFSCDKEE